MTESTATPNPGFFAKPELSPCVRHSEITTKFDVHSIPGDYVAEVSAMTDDTASSADPLAQIPMLHRPEITSAMADENLTYETWNYILEHMETSGADISHYYETADLLPPITTESLAEFDMANTINKPGLRHDVDFDRDLHFVYGLDGYKSKQQLHMAPHYSHANRANASQYHATTKMQPPEPPRLFTNSGDAGYRNPVLHPDSSPVSEDQLTAEIKSIYAGLVVVEAKCIDLDTLQASDSNELDNGQWQALIALHRSLLYEHHDFLMATQHPSTTPALKALPIKYSMPARMWKHGIYAFLEVLRHRRPASQEYMLSFIYLAYQMMSLLYETAPVSRDTWIECLGDLARYRMAIEEEKEPYAQWGAVAASRYVKASDRHPQIGRLYHHLAILERPMLRRFACYGKFVALVRPFPIAPGTLHKLYMPIGGESQNLASAASLLPKASFRRLHASNFREARDIVSREAGNKKADIVERQYAQNASACALISETLNKMVSAAFESSTSWFAKGPCEETSGISANIRESVLYHAATPLQAACDAAVDQWRVRRSMLIAALQRTASLRLAGAAIMLSLLRSLPGASALATEGVLAYAERQSYPSSIDGATLPLPFLIICLGLAFVRDTLNAGRGAKARVTTWLITWLILSGGIGLAWCGLLLSGGEAEYALPTTLFTWFACWVFLNAACARVLRERIIFVSLSMLVGGGSLVLTLGLVPRSDTAAGQTTCNVIRVAGPLMATAWTVVVYSLQHFACARKPARKPAKRASLAGRTRRV
ncbi:hypothetical protein LTR10_008088 [Elasticomyces elasticus]|nr:hypothetical protein LTR10_008088 [Elasticomyces elasticus]KAK4971086.1 hypothetical protein LTR42_008065 [Elasticomyces elasticus]